MFIPCVSSKLIALNNISVIEDILLIIRLGAHLVKSQFRNNNKAYQIYVHQKEKNPGNFPFFSEVLDKE